VKDFGRPVRDTLARAGCRFHRHGKGDHDIWMTPEGKRLIVPFKIGSRHTANGILKTAGLPKTF
jgi:hypothetical protein